MNWIDKLERRFGRFAIHNLMLYLIICYAFGFMIEYTNPGFYLNYLSLNMGAVLHGQVWRLVTFLVYPPSTSVIWLLLLSYIYYGFGRTLEQLWGTFRFNLYILIGILGYILAALIIYVIWGYSYILTADNLYWTMLLGFAFTVPDQKLYFYFVLPIKAKWLGIAYCVLAAVQFVLSGGPGRVEIFMSLLNFFVFFVGIRKPVKNVQQYKRRREYTQKMRAAQPAAGPRHRCAVCGRTEEDDPNLEFRYCSKCEGNYEYCTDHIYTHVHVVGDQHMN